MTSNLCIRLPNGEALTAPTEEWLAALILYLDPVTQAKLFETMRRKDVAYSTPGQYVLHAEPGSFTGLLRGPG